MTSHQLPVTFGSAGTSVEVGGFRITEATYAANARVSRHEHQFPSWTAVLTGGFEERFREGEYTCRTGALLTKPATAAHSNEYGDTGARVVIVEISEADLPRIARAFGELADLKNPFTHGHAANVTGLSVATADRIGMDRRTCACL